MKDFITCYVDVNNKYPVEVSTSKITKMTPSGDGKWTTIEFVGGATQIVYHTPEQLKAMMNAK